MKVIIMKKNNNNNNFVASSHLQGCPGSKTPRFFTRLAKTHDRTYTYFYEKSSRQMLCDMFSFIPTPTTIPYHVGRACEFLPV